MPERNRFFSLEVFLSIYHISSRRPGFSSQPTTILHNALQCSNSIGIRHQPSHSCWGFPRDMRHYKCYELFLMVTGQLTGSGAVRATLLHIYIIPWRGWVGETDSQMKSKSVPFLVKGCIPCAQCAAYHFLAHRCTIFLCHLDLEMIDDQHRHPNINIRDIIWLAD